MRLQEIETRLSQIVEECELETADLDALEEETRSLQEERTALIEKMEKRQALVDAVKADTTAEKRTFTPETKETKSMDISSKEYRNAWLENLQGKKLTEERAYAISDTHNAVPTIVADKFFEKLRTVAPLLDHITLLNVKGNLKFITQGTDNPATVHTELGTITPAGDTIVSVELSGKEFAKVIRMSKSVQTMSVDKFEGWLVAWLGKNIARAIEDYILNDSTNGIAHITYDSTNQIVNTATSGYTYKNIVDMVALLPAGYDANAKIITNKKTLYNKIANIVNSAGNPIFVQDTEEGFAGKILGYPVIVDDYVTTANGALYLGDFENVVGNLSEDINVERSEQSGFLAGAIDYRGFAIFDSKVANPEAFVRLVTTA